MNAFIARGWRFLVGSVLAVGLQSGAQAGLITGSWDPAFGPALPNLSWQVRTHWLVPNTCSGAADGIFSTTDATTPSPCYSATDPVRLLAVWVRWFDTTGTPAGDPDNFFEHVYPQSAHYGLCVSGYSDPGCAEPNVFVFSASAAPLVASKVRVEQGQVLGFETIGAGLDIDTHGWPPSAGLHTFNLSFTTNGPVFTCRNNDETPTTDHSCDDRPVALTTELTQVLTTYNTNDQTAPKLGFDANGKAIGVRLNGQGQVVPEPSAWLLTLAAMGALFVSRRRVA